MRPKQPRVPTQMASFLIDPEGRRSEDEPSEPATRIVWILFALLRHDQADVASYVKTFEYSERTFKRDVHRLQQIGERCGFKVGPVKKGIVKLASREAQLKPLFAESQQLLDLIRTLASAFGKPVLDELAPNLGEQWHRKTFLRVSAPRLVEDSDAGRALTELRGAHECHARVRFRYLGRGDAATNREVEPYGVAWNAGRFYLIAYDTMRRGWRQFALDRIRGPIQRAGTFSPRNVPPSYDAEDALGLFKSDRAVEVTIELSPVIAVAVSCRLWQAAQHVKWFAGGRAQITFVVGDVEEAIRWAMSFGDDARIIEPPEAVHKARAIASRLAARYTTSPAVAAERSA
jgi:predicted DNA-binding transcriptional regulator YafY